MAKEAPRWKRQNPEDRKAAILTTASKHFSTRHYDAVATAEIADELGINRGLLYHYFGTKRELYLEVIRSTVHIPSMPPFPELVAAGTLEDVLDEIVDKWLIEVEQERDAYLAATRFAAFGPDDEAGAMVEASREEAIDVALASLYDDPNSAPSSVRACTRAVGALAETAVVEWLSEGSLSRDQVRVLLVKMSCTLWENIATIVAPPPFNSKRRARADAPTTGVSTTTP